MADKKCDIQGSYKPAYESYQTKNILKLISDHEYGRFKGLSYESHVTKLKVSQLKRSAEEFEIDSDISFCKFLKPSDAGCMIGVWQRNMDPASKHSSVYQLKFVYNQKYCCDEYESCPIISDLSCNGPFFKRMDVTDSCEKNMRDKSLLLYVGNTVVSGGRIVLNITDNSSDSSMRGLSEMIWRSPKNIWSCASNAFSEQFVAGTEKGCFIFDMFNFAEMEIYRGNVLAVEFSKNGNLLYCGLDKNELILYDLRENAWQTLGSQCNHLGLHGVNEIKLLSDEKTMIICTTDGKLWKMDWRMKRPIFQYPDSANKGDRRPLSMDEGLDLMCATGEDNCSRIWSLRSGELLKTIYPFHQRANSHACLIAEQRRWFIAVVQANILTPVLHC